MPKFETVFSGSLATEWEVTPTVGRSLNFALTVRDNRADGGQNTTDEMLVTVAGGAGPFVVTSQSTETTWATGESQTINWNVAGTTGGGVNTANVKIDLVDENGNVLSVLAASTPNDGSHTISVPNITEAGARVRVCAIGNIFYALNGAVVAINTAPAYCSTLCDAEGDTQFPDGTTRVIYNTIDNASTGVPAYTDYTNISTDVAQGASYPLTVNVNTDGGFTEEVRVWIDWNRDCLFDVATEEYDLGTAQNVADGATSNSPLMVMVPADAELGETVMRVTSSYVDGNNPMPGSCDNNSFGEVEDYTLRIVAVLPVELSSFSAKATNNRYVQLDWQTANESNNKGFELERSKDGRAFEAIAWIDGNGTTTNLHSYQYADRNVATNQRYYYRLKQVDYDGSFAYSAVQSAILTANGTVNVYPNPVKELLFVQVTNKSEVTAPSFTLFDALGRVVLQQELTDNTAQLDLSKLPTGVYIYQLRDSGALLAADRLVVE